LPEKSVKLKRQQLTAPKLPLAIYREIVAHLRQVKGVNSGLIPQKSPKFDYLQSQVGGLWIEYETELTPAQEEKVKQILAYYAQKYTPWSNY
jgi:hypothetical protein